MQSLLHPLQLPVLSSSPPSPPLSPRATSDFGSPPPLSFPRASLTTRTMSASCIPISASHPAHECPRCVPPSSPSPSTFRPVPTSPRSRSSPVYERPPVPSPSFHVTAPSALRPPLRNDTLRAHDQARSRSAYKPPAFASRVLTGRSRARSARASRSPLPPTPQRPLNERASARPSTNRAVYNVTTASARAAELAATKHRPPGFLVEPRERPAEQCGVREACDLAPVAVPRHEHAGVQWRRSASDMSDVEKPKRTKKIVVKRRLIRGSSVFRPATEEDIEELIGGDKCREMMRCYKAEIDIAPVTLNTQPLSCDELIETDRELCAQCTNQVVPKKPSPRRGVRRVSSLLSRHLGLEPDADHTIDIAELAGMEECTAVALFLSEIRKYRKEAYFNIQDKAFERSADRGIGAARKREIRAVRKDRRNGKDGKDIRDVKDMERLQSILRQRRSVSADDPALMRALLRQERILLAHATNHRSRKVPSPKPETAAQKEYDVEGKGIGAPDYDRERSRSELVPRRSKHADVDERWKRIVSRYGHVRGSTESVSDAISCTRGIRMESGKDTPSGDKAECDEDAADPVRILTAIEPIDPSTAFEEDETRRGTSYHMGLQVLEVAGRRRRGLTRGVHSREPGLLRRLRSFRRRPVEERGYPM